MTRHDLKNPLSAIINTSESLLESQYLGMDQKDQIEMVRKSSYDMLEMINRSIDLYKMETGSYQLNAVPVDITTICLRVIEESRTNAHKFGILIHYDAPDACLIEGDELLCFSMLGNLIRNAVEASPKEGMIQITIDCDKEVAISIHNEGAIPEEIRGYLFEKYVTAGKDSGTGLGTYSAKLMAETMGGAINFETSEENGTTLIVTLNQAEQ